MPEEKEARLVIEWKRVFPWWHIFRSFSIALDFRKLGLAIVGIVAAWLGWALLALVLDPGDPGPEPARVKETGEANPEWEEWQRRNYLRTITQEWLDWPANVKRGDPDLPPHRAVATLHPRLTKVDYWMAQVPAILEPLTRLVRPLTYFLDERAGWRSYIFATLGVLWTLVVWGFVGGALTRIAAVEFARRDRIPLGEAIRFAARQFPSLLAAPIFPIGVVVVLTVVVWVVATVLVMIPWLGDMIGALTFPLALLAGLLMGVLLLVYAGWPIMYPAVSAEAGDAFDAISRSMSYMYQRPWHYVFYWAVTLVYGVLVLFFVVTFTSFFVYLTGWALNLAWRPWWRSGDVDVIRALFIYAPESYGWRQMLAPGMESPAEVAAKMAVVPRVAAWILGFWLHLVFLGMLGFTYSLFWSASTIIYFLLRKNVDETDLDEVYLEEEQDDLFPRPVTPPEVTLTQVSAPDVTTTRTGGSESVPSAGTETPPKPEGGSAGQ
jgi:hypothetical protein